MVKTIICDIDGTIVQYFKDTKGVIKKRSRTITCCYRKDK